MSSTRKLLSIVIPAYNESANIKNTYSAIRQFIPNEYDYEIIIVNDGSRDNTAEVVRGLNAKDKQVKLLYFARNFGKEVATTAGLNYAQGDITIVIDADGQHPPELIPEFIQLWMEGAQVVVGVRTSNVQEGFIKKWGSKLFYKLLSRLSRVKMVPASTDFRLIDKEVREAFSKLEETNRITRGLIDWLGYDVKYLKFRANARLHGEAAYSIRKLVSLALNSFISLSFMPLYLSGYIGLLMTGLSFVIGLFIFVESVLLPDPLGLDITGSGVLGLLTVFLIGLVLIGQGLTALYTSRIYEEVKRRPLYVINKAQSIL